MILFFYLYPLYCRVAAKHRDLSNFRVVSESRLETFRDTGATFSNKKLGKKSKRKRPEAKEGKKKQNGLPRSPLLIPLFIEFRLVAALE